MAYVAVCSQIVSFALAWVRRTLDLSGNPGLTGIDNIKLATGLKELIIAGSNLGTKLRAHTFLATLTKLT